MTAPLDVSVSRVMQAPPDRIRRIMFDPMQDPGWMAAVKSVERIDTHEEPGARVRRIGRFLGRPLRWTTELIARTPSRPGSPALIRRGPQRTDASAACVEAFRVPGILRHLPVIEVWAAVEVGRVVRATTISMVLLAVPGLGLLLSAIALHESFNLSLDLGILLIGAGIWVVTSPSTTSRVEAP
jgi:hypothetical protein